MVRFTHEVRINSHILKIESYELGMQNARFRVLITAGMDGDEPAAISAAEKLIQILKEKNYPDFLITIIPIVNVVGYKCQVSYNPMDKLFPKNIYPGSANGKATEQLIWWLHENFIRKSQAWIDLHGGALLENLTPFINGFKTHNRNTDLLTETLLSGLKENLVIYEYNHHWLKIKELTRDNVAYIISESGCRGKTDTESVNLHIRRVLQSLALLKNGIKAEFKYYRHLEFIHAPLSGFWDPVKNAVHKVKSGELLGVVTGLDGNRKLNVITNSNGIILWQTVNSLVEKGANIGGIASDYRISSDN